MYSMGMEKYMGYKAREVTRPERELPCFDIDGTLFQVDINKSEFRQLDQQHNRIAFGEIKEEYGFSIMLYDTRTKNRFLNGGRESNDVPGHVRLVILPPLKELDPVGLARLHGFSDEYYRSKVNSEKPKVALIAQVESSKPKQKKKRGLSF